MKYYCKKVLLKRGGKLRVFLSNPPVSYSKLKLNDLLDTNDLMRIFGVTLRTIYRWLEMGNLKFHKRVGREYYFKKSDIDWFSHNRTLKTKNYKINAQGEEMIQMTKKELLEENEFLRSKLNQIKEKVNAAMDDDDMDDDDQVEEDDYDDEGEEEGDEDDD